MSWLLLLILAPAILVPIVLLCGFAGCGLDVTGTGLPAETPDVPKARLEPDRKSVSFTWLPRGGTADSFNIVRTDTAGNVANFTTPGTVSTLIDTSTSLTAGMTFGYQVAAVSYGTATPLTGPRQVTIPPAAPVLTAVPSATKISLSWTPSPHATAFRLEHVSDMTVIPPSSPTTAEHTVAPGSTHSYRVFAIVANGFDDSTSKAVESDPSNTVQVTAAAPTWTTIFTTAGVPANPNNGQNLSGSCVVQRIPAPSISGTLVRVTLRSVDGRTTQLTAVTISKAEAAGAGQPQNSLDNPRALSFTGGAGVTIPGGQASTSDVLAYPIAAGQDLHVAFNVSGASDRILRRIVATHVSYTRNSAADAGSQNRPGYTPQAGEVFCVERVEIA